MPTFQYNALDKQGQPVDGALEAENVGEAVEHLQAKGLTLLSIALEGEAFAEGTEENEDDENRELAEALEEPIDRLLSIKESLAEPLSAYACEIPTGKKRRELQAINRLLASGDRRSVIEAAAAHPAGWAPLLAASSCEDPCDAFARFVELDQQKSAQHRQWRLALGYPLFIVVFAMIVLAVIANFILPTFVSIFDDFGLELPAMTEFVVAFGSLLTFSRLPVGALIIFSVAFAWDRLIGWPWTIGRNKALRLTRLTQVTATLLEAGVPAHLALRAGSAQAGRRLRARSEDLAEMIQDKSKQGRVRPPSYAIAYALNSDLPGATSARLMQELSLCHQDKAARLSSWTSGAMGPGAIVLIGILVGFVVMALFLPLVRLLGGLT